MCMIICELVMFRKFNLFGGYIRGFWCIEYLGRNLMGCGMFWGKIIMGYRIFL